METGNGNWKWKLEMEIGTKIGTINAPITWCSVFFHRHHGVALNSCILVSSDYMTGFMSHVLSFTLVMCSMISMII